MLKKREIVKITRISFENYTLKLKKRIIRKSSKRKTLNLKNRD